MDQAELVLRLAVVGIDGGGFEHAAVVLAAAESRAEAGEFGAEVIDQIEEEERRGEEAEDHRERAPEEDRGGERDPGEADDSRGRAVAAPKTVRTAKKISTAK